MCVFAFFSSVDKLLLGDQSILGIQGISLHALLGRLQNGLAQTFDLPAEHLGMRRYMHALRDHLVLLAAKRRSEEWTR